MFFPYGEWVIISLAVFSIIEKRPSRLLFLSLIIAWAGGKTLESFTPVTGPWHWHYEQLFVMLVFWRWAWKRSEKRIFPLFLILLSLTIQDLFILNEPGIILYEQWLFAGLLLFAAWFSTLSYWEMSAALAGGAILNQVVIVYLYDGIVRHIDLPGSFLWNFSVIVLTLIGLAREGLSLKSKKQEQALLNDQESDSDPIIT